jgi:hypothetical protein
MVITDPDHRARIERLCDALESGEFNQTTGALRNSYGYCCMGVACEISGLHRWVERAKQGYFAYGTPGSVEPETDVSAGLEAGYLPTTVSEWYGWNGSNNPVVKTDDGGLATLSQLNDLKHANFCAIAHVIRRTYLGEDEVTGA